MFATTSLVQDVNEPEGGIGLPVTLLVQRNGGSNGVSQVDWSISRSDGEWKTTFMKFMSLFVQVHRLQLIFSQLVEISNL